MLNNISYILAQYLNDRKTYIHDSQIFLMGVPLCISIENEAFLPINNRGFRFNFLNPNFLEYLVSLTNSYFDIHRPNKVNGIWNFLKEEKSNILIVSDEIFKYDKRYPPLSKGAPLYCLINSSSLIKNKLFQETYVNLIFSKNYTQKVSLLSLINAWNIDTNHYFNSNYIFYSFPVYSEDYSFQNLFKMSLIKQAAILNSRASGFQLLKDYKSKICQLKRSDDLFTLLDDFVIPVKKYIYLNVFDMFRREYADSLIRNIDLLPLETEILIQPLQQLASCWEEIAHMIEKDEYRNIRYFIEGLNSLIECEYTVACFFKKMI